MAEVKWIKITTDIFDDEKILLIEQLPSADSIIVIWFKLLTLAGKQNNDGVFVMNDKIPYTDEMLSAIFRRDLNTVRMALNTFSKFGMIEIVGDVITIPNWNKHQSLDAYEKKKERDRIYQAQRRERQKIMAESVKLIGENVETNEKSSDSRLNNRLTSSDVSDEQSSCVAISDKIRLEEEEDKNKNNIYNNLKPKEIVGSETLNTILQKWNEIGISKLRSINSTRKKLLNCRIHEYGVDAVIEAISNVKESDFLKGQNDRGWVATFDWMIKPTNFVKVLEGNYKNRNPKQHTSKSLENLQELYKEESDGQKANDTTTYDFGD